MSALNVQNVGTDRNAKLVVDSRLIVERLGIEHINFMETIGTYQSQIEQAFGVVRFETGKPPSGSKGGRPQKYALLTEDQATFLMTLSRNTPEVVQCKIELVVAFSKAKDFLKGVRSEPEPLKLAPPIERVASLMASLKFFDIDTENPRFKQELQDLTLDVLGISKRPALPGEVEEWCGVVERAEQLGIAPALVTKHRSKLGKAIANRPFDSTDRREEKRLCNGTLRNVNLNRVTHDLDSAINDYFTIWSGAS